jgi:hypothetical protein
MAESTRSLIDKLFKVSANESKDYGVYKSDKYKDWRKKNNLTGSSGSQSLIEQLKKKPEDKALIKKANVLLNKWYKPLVDLDKKKARQFKLKTGDVIVKERR